MRALLNLCATALFSVALGVAVNGNGERVADFFTYVQTYCCRVGNETAGCAVGKESLLDLLQGGTSISLNYMSLFKAMIIFLGLLVAFVAVYTVYYFVTHVAWLNLKRFASNMVEKIAVSFITPFIIVTITLCAIEYSYVQFQPWESNIQSAGCCCCWNNQTQACNSQACLECYTHRELISAGINTSGMPYPPDIQDWGKHSLASLVVVAVGIAFYWGAYGLGLFITSGRSVDAQARYVHSEEETGLLTNDAAMRLTDLQECSQRRDTSSKFQF